jgi:hypothetical protein
MGCVVALSALVIAAQPISAPWWINADADATYTASAAELMAGEHTLYLDHPGLPLQDLMAISFELRYAVHNLSNSSSPHAYVAQRLLHLDDSRFFFRGWALLFFIGGVAATFFVGWRFLGGPFWGAACAALWMSAPDLAAMSIQFRPDGLLAGLVVLCGYLIVRAAQRRSAWTYTLAALLLGLTMTVKLHAAGLLVPFAIALLWRPPLSGWEPGWRADARAWLSRYRVPLTLFAVAWIALSILFNRSRAPLTLTAEQRTTVSEVSGGLGVYLLALLVFAKTPLERWGRGPVRPFGGVLVSALVVGVLLPGTLFVNDLPEMLVKLVGGLTGGAVNEGITPFSLPMTTLLHWPLVYTLLMVCIAGVAASVGVVRRDLTPLLWFTGALATGLMALARLGTIHYFEPAFALSIPAALWLVRSLPRPAIVPAATVLLIVMLNPLFSHLGDSKTNARVQVRTKSR